MDNAHYKDGARGSALAVSDKIVFEPFPVTLWEIAERLDFSGRSASTPSVIEESAMIVPAHVHEIARLPIEYESKNVSLD
jgi:hypothetical protein